MTIPHVLYRRLSENGRLRLALISLCLICAPCIFLLLASRLSPERQTVVVWHVLSIQEIPSTLMSQGRETGTAWTYVAECTSGDQERRFTIAHDEWQRLAPSSLPVKVGDRFYFPTESIEALANRNREQNLDKHVRNFLGDVVVVEQKD